MADLTLLVLAAGMGSRYGGLKQIDPFGPNGETIMDYSVYDALRAGFNKVVFVIRREFEETFRERIGNRYHNRITVDYVFQELASMLMGHALPADRTRPWGTTHAILMASDVIREPFAVINSDDFYGAAGYAALAKHLTSGTSDYAMVAYPLFNTLSDFGSVSRGLCHVDAKGYLKDIVELKNIERRDARAVTTDAEGRQSQLPAGSVVSMNMWGFTPQVFPQLRERFSRFLEAHGNDPEAECYIPTTINELVQAGEARVQVLHSSGTWFGVTYREDRAHVADSLHRLIEAGYYPNRLWA
jgi:dTDP-glucose pyrophosphorylase